MAATDYDILVGMFDLWLAKRKKPTKNGPQTMSADRRRITESEMIGCFEFYLRKYCKEHHTDTVVITDDNGKKIFEAKLLDQDNE